MLRPELFSVAPLMAYTDRHFRFMFRLLSRHATLYTEMVAAPALYHKQSPMGGNLGDGSAWPGSRVDRWLRILPSSLSSASSASSATPSSPVADGPTVLQLGGFDADHLAAGTRMAVAYGYDAVNLNVGCPSPRVAGRGNFGAALMKEPETVAMLTRAMIEAADGGIAVTVKCRTGVDDMDTPEHLSRFVGGIAEAGVRRVVVHARKAYLNGLSPAENRTVPPLNHDRVFDLCREFPEMDIILNGGIESPEQASALMARGGIAGCMVGRGVLERPMAWSTVDADLFDRPPSECAMGGTVDSLAVLGAYGEYAAQEAEEAGTPTRRLVKPLLNLFAGAYNGKAFRKRADRLMALKGRDLVPVGVIIADLAQFMKEHGEEPAAESRVGGAGGGAGGGAEGAVGEGGAVGAVGWTEGHGQPSTISGGGVEEGEESDQAAHA